MTEGLEERAGLLPTVVVFTRSIEVQTHPAQSANPRNVDLGGDGDAGFAAGGSREPHDPWFEQRPAAEQHLAIFPALEGHRRAVPSVHFGEAGVLGRLVDAAGALRATIHFLEGDEIGTCLAHDAGDALEVEPAVDALAVVQVVGEETQGRWFAGARPASQEGSAGRGRGQAEKEIASVHRDTMNQRVGSTKPAKVRVRDERGYREARPGVPPRTVETDHAAGVA